MDLFHWALDSILFLFVMLLAIDSVTMFPVRRIYEFCYSFVIKINPHYLLMIDLDKFKGINDKYGHRAGDKFLRLTGRTISKVVPFRGFRYGGEEFVVLLPWTNKERAIEIAERIRKAIEEIRLGEIKTTASIGVGIWEQDADAAMYMAKKNGRNQIQVFAGPG